MPIFQGSTEDGIDAHQIGVYESPDGKEWSNMPFTREQRQHERELQLHRQVFETIKNEKELRAEHALILQKRSRKSRRHRDYIIKLVREIDEQRTDEQTGE